MSHRHLVIVFSLVVLLVRPFLQIEEASAQVPVDPDSIAVWLTIDGESRIAGQTYREGADPEHYVEHWVLYSSYVYPSADNGAVVTLKPGFEHYRSTAEFLARVAFEPGSRYVKVDCRDSKTNPFGPITVPGRPRAQIPVDPDSVGVWLAIDGGEPVLAGQVYREGADPEHYVEHWVLYPNYVYPSAANGAVVTLEPGYQHFESVEDFLGRVPFEKGSRYVEADCLDTRSIPGR